MEHSRMNTFEEANNVAAAIERIENTVIDSLTGQPKAVTDYIAELLSTKRPHMIFSKDGLAETWKHGRNRDQVITDWLMETYRRIVLHVCSDKVLDLAREVYADSLYIGDITALYDDEDLGSRLPKKEVVVDLLKTHRWSLVIIALYSIDLSEIGVGHEESRATSAN